MDSTPQQPESNDDWLLSPSTAPVAPVQPTTASEPVDETVEPSDVLSSRPTEGRKALLTGSALVAAGLIAGAVGTFALGNRGGATTVQSAGNSVRQNPDRTGLAPGAAGQNDVIQGGPGLQGGPPARGGIDGEQHLQGTLTAIGRSSITVTTRAGSTTYTVTSSTEIVRDGLSATLSQLQKGDPVLVHVYPLNGQTVVERVLAGFPGHPCGSCPQASPGDGPARATVRA